MKKFGKVVATAMSATMLAGMLAGCGGATEAKYEYVPTMSNDGKVLNVYAWNTEFIERFTAYYPGYEAANADDVTAGGKIGDVTVKFTIVPSDDNAYQDNLDQHLAKQADADADDKIDLFLVEADYALKYVDNNNTLAMADLGVDTMGDQYQYTKDVVTDRYGNVKGSSWQGCPGALIYSAEIAEAVLGTSDPAEVQAYVKDWTTFQSTAATVAESGYLMTATANDTYRVFSNNVTSKWVVDGKINVDENIKTWVEMSKAMVDAGQTGTDDLWSPAWSAGFAADGNVFCYFGPAWLIDFCMNAHSEDDADYGTSRADNGDWRVTAGPQGFYWGGTWVCAANGTDNADLVGDIIKTMTTDDDVLAKIIEEKNDFVNDSALIQKYSTDANFGSKILGGQNPLPIFADKLSSVDLSNITGYDQGCNEEFQKAMKGYFDGNYATYDDALKAFYQAVTTKYPAVKAPK